jgi:hypothetical protein
MSEQKQIKINIADFNFNTTRKTKTKDKAGPGIKVKTQVSKPKLDTLKKRSLLRMIRQQQEDRYNKLFGTSSNKSSPEIDKKIPEMVKMDTELEKAKEYLNNLKEKQESSTNSHNATIRRHPIIQSASLPISNTSHNAVGNTPPNTVVSPMYGCMKNGNLPTYRNYNRTSKNQPIIQIGNPTQLQVNPSQPNNIIMSPPTMSIPPLPLMGSVISRPKQLVEDMSNINIIDQKLTSGLKRMAELKQAEAIMARVRNNNRPKRMMQKRTVRRTYKIGRSTVLPKIAVLVSNKTIRNNATTKSQLLKQVSMPIVRRELIKRGLIRVGSTTPNDVLRKMYESTMLMCGDIQNHNADNLLYNFINDEKEH